MPSMPSMPSGNATIPSMADFSTRITGSVKRYAGFFLALSLLTALWSTALGRISERQTAITLLTKAGTDILNPLLLANGSGLAQTFYAQIEQQANAHPNQQLAIPFLKIAIQGKTIAHKDYAQGSQAIYAQVATAYYNGGPTAVFNLPPELQQAINGYTPFTQPTNGAKSPFPTLPLPQLPAFATQLYSTVGITPTSLTAAGHATAVSRSLWLWLISAALAIILALMNTGWNRLWAVAWSIFHASWHIALIGIIGTIVLAAHVQQAEPYRAVLNLIGGTFMPVFYGAALVGAIGVAISLIGQRRSAPAGATPASAPQRAPRQAPGLSGAPLRVPATEPMSPEPMRSEPVDDMTPGAP